MPEVGVEPTRPEGHGILSPARLPVPPLRRDSIVASGASCLCEAGGGLCRPGGQERPLGAWRQEGGLAGGNIVFPRGLTLRCYLRTSAGGRILSHRRLRPARYR